MAVSKKTFEEYHALNPDIYAALKVFALDAVRAGRTRLGIKLLIERVRWHTTIEARGDKFKVNNNYLQPYAKLLMEQEPELAGLFLTRTRKARA